MKALLFSLSLIGFFFYQPYSFANTVDAKATPPSAKVMIAKGDVFFEGKKVNQGEIIGRPGKLTTGERGFVKLFIEKWGNEILIGSKSEMILNFEDMKKYTLTSGSCRWITALKKEVAANVKEENKAKGGIFTKQASMGIRGTDFLLIANPLLGETEVVMFDGLVEFKNLNDESNKVEIAKNQWGGIGGRFGQKIAPVITLGQEQISVFKTLLAE